MAKKGYLITVRNETESTGTVDGAQPSVSGFGDNPVTLKQVAAAGIAARFTKQIFQYEVSRVGVRTGNSYRQDKIDFWMGVGGQVASIAITTAINPALGLANAVGIAISYAQKAEAYEWDRRWASVSSANARLRAGPSLNRSRLG